MDGPRGFKGRWRRYRDAQSPSNLHPITRNTSCGDKNSYPSLTVVLCTARSINNKTAIVQSYMLEQAVDLALMIKTSIREGEVVALNQLVPSGFSVLHQTRTNAGESGIMREAFSFKVLSSLRISGIECLAWESKKRLAIWMVMHHQIHCWTC